MTNRQTLFDLFGGIRPMARALEEAPSNVMSWKTVGRIPAEKQPHVLSVARDRGLPVTAEDIIFPLGHEVEMAAGPARVISHA